MLLTEYLCLLVYSHNVDGTFQNCISNSVLPARRPILYSCYPHRTKHSAGLL